MHYREKRYCTKSRKVGELFKHSFQSQISPSIQRASLMYSAVHNRETHCRECKISRTFFKFTLFVCITSPLGIAMVMLFGTIMWIIIREIVREKGKSVKHK